MTNSTAGGGGPGPAPSGTQLSNNTKAILPKTSLSAAHPESIEFFKKQGHFGVLADLPAPKTSTWEPFMDACAQFREREKRLVSGELVPGNTYTDSEGNVLTTSEYFRQKKFDEAMFRFESDA